MSDRWRIVPTTRRTSKSDRVDILDGHGRDGEVYARAWFNLKPAAITADHISDDWETARG